MLMLSDAEMGRQAWVCVAMVLPVAAIFMLSRAEEATPAQSLALGGLFVITAIVVVSAQASPKIALAWTILTPIEIAIIVTAALSMIGGLFPVGLLLGLAFAERIGLIGSGPELRAAALLAPPAAVCGAILIHVMRATREAQRQTDFVSTRRYGALAHAAGDLVLHHDVSGNVLAVGDEVSQWLQIESDALTGTRFLHRLHVADRPLFLHAFSTALHGDVTTTATVRLRSGAIEKSSIGFAEPVFVWIEIRLRRLPSDDGRVEAGDGAAVVSSLRDLTDAKETERRLEVARAEAAVAVSMKDRMLANVSHELRTPLNAILGFSEILGDPDLVPSEADKRREYARIIHSSAEHLLSVVNLVLDMSRIEAGKFEIAPEPFDIEGLIRGCCDMLRLKAEAGNVELVRTPAAGDPHELVADKRACRQILLNLMSNAVKFTPPGGRVTVGAETIDSMIHVYVADTGIGIAAEDLPRLGDPFFQAKSNYDRSFEGAGLGLSLVRGLVGLHGGALSLESAPGMGTRVTVRLPLDCRTHVKTIGGVTRFETASMIGRTTPGASGSTEPPFRIRASKERKIA